MAQLVLRNTAGQDIFASGEITDARAIEIAEKIAKYNLILSPDSQGLTEADVEALTGAEKAEQLMLAALGGLLRVARAWDKHAYSLLQPTNETWE